MNPDHKPTFADLPPRARLYIAGALAVALVALAGVTVFGHGRDLDLVLLAIVVLGCTAGNLFQVFAPGHYHYSFEPSGIFFFFGVVLLPPWAIAVTAVLSFAPAIVLKRSPWFKEAFNFAVCILSGLAAYAVTQGNGAIDASTPAFRVVATLLVAVVVMVALNHLMVVLAVGLAGERPLRKSLREFGDGIPLDIALTATGACLAALWVQSPPLAALAAGPIILIYRALYIPMLTHKARTDSKTGLFNFEHFTSEFDAALALAEKDESSLAVVMFDLDHLRQVNNRCGHLAGDRLIRAVAEALTELAGRDGVVGRFGGEEFALLLPGASLADGCDLAERAREQISQISLRADDGVTDLRVTISGGVAAYPEHGATPTALLSAADAALYDAKLGGRNRIRTALPPGAREALDFAVPDTSAGAEHAPAPVVPVPAGAVPALAATPVVEITEARPTEAPLRAEGHDGGEPALWMADVPSIPAEAEPLAPGPAARPHLIPWFAAALTCVALAVAGLSSPTAILATPVLFAMLMLSVVALDVVRLDIFERANISPASVPGLVLAYLFGPLGIIAAELGIFVMSLLRRERVVRSAFDFGALSAAGVVAALTFQLISPEGTGALLLTGGLCGLVYYTVNMSLLAFVIGLSEGTSPIASWREGLKWLWPHYLSFGLLAGVFVVTQQQLGAYVFAVFAMPIGMIWLAQRQYLSRSRSSVAELRQSHGELEAANKRLRGLLGDNQDLLGRMHRSYLSTITSLARTIEAKDPYTGGHTERVARITYALAEELGFDESQLRAVNVGAVIHDIGKIGIADEILLKPGSLTSPEFGEMRRHPEIASYILADLELPPIVKQMVRSHHERFDGTGYPDRIAGEEIPLAARILSVADAIDAMTSERPYRKALSLEEAWEEIEAKAGTQFCPQAVEALRAYLARDSSLWAHEVLVA